MSANLSTTVNNTQPPDQSSCYSTGTNFGVISEKIGRTFAYSVILVLSLTGNSFIAIIVYKTKTMRKTINFLIVNMAISDLLVPILSVSWIITDFYAGSWLISGPFGQALCKLVSLSTVISMSVSIQSLVLIAVDRFGAVVLPLRSPLISPKHCPFFILATWIIAIATQFPHLFVYKLVEYKEKLSCEPRWNEAFGKSSFFVARNYVIALSVLELYIPFSLICILYSFVLIKLKKHKSPGVQSLSAEKQRAKTQKNVLRVAIAIVMGCALCWLPLSIFTVVATFLRDHTTWSCSNVRIFIIVHLLAQANCAVNPCICFIFSGNYRQGLKNLFNPLLSRIFLG